MPNIEIINDEPYLEPNTIKIAVHNTVHQSNFWQHSHRFFEFVYVADGFSLHSYNGKTSLLTSGDLFAVCPGDIHSYIAAHNANIYNILFYPEELGEFKAALDGIAGVGERREGSGEKPTMIRVDLGDRTELVNLLDSMIDERKKRRAGWELNLKAKLTSFLVMFSRWVRENAPEGSDRQGYCGYIYNVLSYVAENYAGDIDSAALAQVSGVSADHLARQFKSVMSMTPVEYVRRFRVGKAMDMLKTTDMSIAEVAEASGFSDISHFSHVFKQTVGTSPAMFRKE